MGELSTGRWPHPFTWVWSILNNMLLLQTTGQVVSAVISNKEEDDSDIEEAAGEPFSTHLEYSLDEGEVDQLKDFFSQHHHHHHSEQAS